MTRHVMKSKKIRRGHVYVVSATNGYLKLGSATSAFDRLCNIACNSPLPVTLDYVCTCDHPRDIEEAAHKKLADHRRHREWFEVPTKLAIGAIREAIMERGETVQDAPHRQDLKKPGSIGTPLVLKAKINEISSAKRA